MEDYDTIADEAEADHYSRLADEDHDRKLKESDMAKAIREQHEEFNLSNKIIEIDENKHIDGAVSIIGSGDVKEFIRRLRENLINDCQDCHNWNLRFIDKLAGEKLI